jgi:hypothetical protein
MGAKINDLSGVAGLILLSYFKVFRSADIKAYSFLLVRGAYCIQVSPFTLLILIILNNMFFPCG